MNEYIFSASKEVNSVETQTETNQRDQELIKEMENKLKTLMELLEKAESDKSVIEQMLEK